MKLYSLSPTLAVMLAVPAFLVISELLVPIFTTESSSTLYVTSKSEGIYFILDVFTAFIWLLGIQLIIYFLKNEGLYFTRYILLYFCVTQSSKIALKQFPPGEQFVLIKLNTESKNNDKAC